MVMKNKQVLVRLRRGGENIQNKNCKKKYIWYYWGNYFEILEREKDGKFFKYYVKEKYLKDSLDFGVKL